MSMRSEAPGRSRRGPASSRPRPAEPPGGHRRRRRVVAGRRSTPRCWPRRPSSTSGTSTSGTARSRRSSTSTMPIPRGKVTALIGPSGCGKSTLLRSVNRLNDLIDIVRIERRHAAERRHHLRPRRRRDRAAPAHGHGLPEVQPVPHEHLRERGLRPADRRRAQPRACWTRSASKACAGAALWDEVKDRLHESALGLSGGQQQRLCIARAIAAEPEVLLMDEPCSALDPIATGKIEDLIRELRGDYTILIVTHNMQQASRVSDYTAFMYLGRSIEYGPTARALHQSASARRPRTTSPAASASRRRRSGPPGNPSGGVLSAVKRTSSATDLSANGFPANLLPMTIFKHGRLRRPVQVIVAA